MPDSLTGSSVSAGHAIEHAVRALSEAAEGAEPFAHLRFTNFFPADLYAAMLAAMPAPEDYRRMSGRARSAKRGDVRTKLDLFPEWVALLPPHKREVWAIVGETLRSAPVREAFMRRLAPGLERRFGARHAHASLYPVPVLTRDVPGYRIGIHPDTKWKGITAQVYLPPDRSIEHVGTLFHRRQADGAFETVTRMPFHPNAGYAFAVGPDTFHSVATVGPEVTTRDSILLTYFVDRTLFERLHNRSKRFGNALRAAGRRLGMG
jgi:hypothetical protein